VNPTYHSSRSQVTDIGSDYGQDEREEVLKVGGGDLGVIGEILTTSFRKSTMFNPWLSTADPGYHFKVTAQILVTIPNPTLNGR
jgi:hypothetical protein